MAARWRQLAGRALTAFFANDCPLAAAAIAYYILLSIFPLALLVLAIGSQFVEPARLQHDLLGFFNQYVAGSRGLVGGMVRNLDRHTTSFGLLGLVGAVWAGMGVFGALRTALNQAWGVRETRPFWAQRGLEAGMAVGVGVLFAVSAAAGSAIDGAGFAGLRFLLAAAIAYVGFAACYQWIPNARRHSWSASRGAALVATLLFELARLAFLAYLHDYADYSLLYGALGAVIVFLIWAYASAAILLFGGQLAREMASSH